LIVTDFILTEQK